MSGDDEVSDLAARLGAEAAALVDGHDTELDAIAVARRLGRLADAILRAAVSRARDAGRTWQQISDVLGTTRQAAFQRFGKPIDPRTGGLMSHAVLPDASARAETVISLWLAGRWDEAYAAARPLTDQVTERLSPGLLGDALAEVIGTVGAYERMGEPVVHQQGDHTVVDIPLEFEAGEMTGRVTYDPDGRTAGLFILRSDTP